MFISKTTFLVLIPSTSRWFRCILHNLMTLTRKPSQLSPSQPKVDTPSCVPMPLRIILLQSPSSGWCLLAYFPDQLEWILCCVRLGSWRQPSNDTMKSFLVILQKTFPRSYSLGAGLSSQGQFGQFHLLVSGISSNVAVDLVNEASECWSWSGSPFPGAAYKARAHCSTHTHGPTACFDCNRHHLLKFVQHSLWY